MQSSALSAYKNPLSSFSGSETKSDKIRDAIKHYDKNLLLWLGKVYSMLDRDEIEPNDVTAMVDMLEKIKSKSERKYLKDLIYPEDARDAKIPTSFPVPTSSFQLHGSFTLTTNTSGNIAGYVAPNYLTTDLLSTFFVNNNVNLTGNASSNFFAAVDADQTIPANVYQRYRLVSYSMVLTYIGRWDIVSGIIGGAVTFDQGLGAPTALTTPQAGGARYGNFDLVDDSYYSHRTNSINGIRIVYVPADPAYENYTNVSTANGSEQLHFYGQGLPPSAQCLRIDTFANFECLADPVFQNYIPSSCVEPQPGLIKQATQVLTQNKDLVISSVKAYEENKPGFFDALWGGMKKFATGVYDISKKGFQQFGMPLAKLASNFIPGGKILASALPMLESGGMDIDMVD